MTFSALEQQELADSMVIANTPASLAVWLEKQHSVQRLADTLSEDRLLDGLHAAVNTAPPTETTLGTAYAFLVALTIKRNQTGEPLGGVPVDPSVLSWADAIWKRAKFSSAVTKTVIASTGDPPQPTVKVSTPDQRPGTTLLVNEFGHTLIRTEEG